MHSISHYYCIESINLSKSNITDIYYYTGQLIEKDNQVEIDQIPLSVLINVTNKISAIIELNPSQNINYKSIDIDGESYYGSGFLSGNSICYLILYSLNRIEIFEIEKTKRHPEKFYKLLIDGYFTNEIETLRNEAMFIFYEQIFN